MKINGKTYPNWVGSLVTDLAYKQFTFDQLAEKYQKSKSVIYKYNTNPDIKQEIARLRREYIDEMRESVTSMLDDALQVYRDLLKKSDVDSTRLKAASDILKHFEILVDKKEIDINLYRPAQINFEEEIEEDGE